MISNKVTSLEINTKFHWDLLVRMVEIRETSEHFEVGWHYLLNISLSDLDPALETKRLKFTKDLWRRAKNPRYRIRYCPDNKPYIAYITPGRMSQEKKLAPPWAVFDILEKYHPIHSADTHPSKTDTYLRVYKNNMISND